MELNTKFDVGDTIYFVDPRTEKIRSSKINLISVVASNGEVITYFQVGENEFNLVRLQEGDCYSSLTEIKNNKTTKEAKYPIKFKCKTSGYKFKAYCEIADDGYDYYGLGDTKKKATDDLIKTLNVQSSYTWKCIEKPEPYLIIK